jgi:site-specific DNA-cytosine methylase
MNVLDLFSGTGGFSIGLSQAGMQTVAFCECDDHAKRVLQHHWPDVPVFDDVKAITKEYLYENGIQSVDVICGGFPCQDISIAGKNAGIENGERSGLWGEYKRIIADVRPKYAIIENVSALLSRGLNVVLSDLAEVGYDATWTVIDSQYTGVPQRRRRVYILAVRDGIPADADIFRFEQRGEADIGEALANIHGRRAWNFEAGAGVGHPFAYFTRQRSDQFACCAVAGTIAKRDYKSFTDLVLEDGIVRRVTPTERLRLQGYSEDFFDGITLSEKEKFTLNGMTIPAVKWVGDCVVEFNKTFGVSAKPAASNFFTSTTTESFS